MKTRLQRFIAPLVLVLLGSSAATSAAAPTPPADEVVILSFFRDNGQDGIYFAWSNDGLNFKPLNGDKPVMKPGPWPGQQLTRDPSIIYQNGKFHLVWTTNWTGRSFGCAESVDLKDWSEPVKVEPFAATLPANEQPTNVWAPEICWDPRQHNYLVVWSSTTGRTGGHRLYSSRTADLKTFSDAKSLLDPGYTCIDGMLVLENERWLLVFKDEREVKDGGKNLKLAAAPADFSTPWMHAATPIAGPGSNIRNTEMAEGPSLLRWKDTWYLYWDAFANGHYALATSNDLKTWTDRTAELKLPPNPRHGTVFRAPRAAVAELRESPAR